ncbi:hypothetical protein VTK56DRAFT_9207 [Thermocarpiscus australiensis]
MVRAALTILCGALAIMPALTILCGALAIIPAVSAATADSRAGALKNAPPGISYTIPKATHSLPGVKFTTETQHFQRLQAVHASKSNPKSAAAILGAHQRHAGGFGYENVTASNAYGTQYGVQVLWDGQPVSLILDTGSSDTWVVQDDFQCIDYIGVSIPQEACAFGPAYSDNFQYGFTDPETHMFIRYGDGEVVAGPMGYSDIAVGGITVKKQQVCLANTTFWFGNNYTSGVMGLAFPSLTNAYPGNIQHHEPANLIQYPPLFTSMVDQGLVDPVFSLAIDRNSSTGILAFGGIASATGIDLSKTTSLDMVITNVVGRPETASQYSFYTVIPDGWEYDHITDSKKFPYIVDSGTTLCYLPPSLAEAINGAFNPPAVYMYMYGAYFTSCDAFVPQVAVLLDGVKFRINPVDLIYRNVVDPLTGLCMTAVTNGGDGPYILGDTFMYNALVVFDIGEAKMRFIPRRYY